MKEFAGRIAVVTGGGSGMGRELVRQLVVEACNVSMCDLAAEGMAETVRLCEAAGLPQGLRVTTHIADVSDFAQMERFRAEVGDRHATDRIHLLFNNAGIGGGGSLIVNSCEEWERTFKAREADRPAGATRRRFRSGNWAAAWLAASYREGGH